MLAIKPYEFWFLTGSQQLYGEETLLEEKKKKKKKNAPIQQQELKGTGT